jgi:D-aspartate ligase
MLGHTVQTTTQRLACVAGDLSLVRSLGRFGIPVALVTSEPQGLDTRSRYCKAVIETPSWVTHPDGAIDALIAWARRQSAKPVLFYQGDHDLVAISRSRDKLAPFFDFVLPPREIVEQLTDKLKFEDLAREKDLPVPHTLRLRRGQDFIGLMKEWETFPAVLKPSMRTNWYARIGCNQKALRVETREELDRQLALMGNGQDLLVQQAVEGGEEQIVSYHAYVRADGSVAGEFTGRKIRTAPRLYGMSSHVVITDDAEVRRVGRDIVRRIGFTGVLKIDFKIDVRDQRMFMLEINARFNLWHHPGSVAGVPLPLLVYEDCTGAARRFAAAPPIARPGVRWVDPVLDWMAAKEYRAAGELSWRRWMIQLATVDINEGFSWRDPMPGWMAFWARVERRLSKWFGWHEVRTGH